MSVLSIHMIPGGLGGQQFHDCVIILGCEIRDTEIMCHLNCPDIWIFARRLFIRKENMFYTVLEVWGISWLSCFTLIGVHLITYACILDNTSSIVCPLVFDYKPGPGQSKGSSLAKLWQLL